MGIEIKRADFDAEDRRRFAQRLETQLAQLHDLLSRPGFGRGASSVGAELELYLVDAQGLPAFVNEEVHAACADPQLTLELNRYNLEYNLLPHSLGGGGLLATEREILSKLAALRARAADLDARVVPIGILPTLREQDFGIHCVTNRTRYHALVSQLLRWRGSAFNIDINGSEPLKIGMSDITLEGANTSFQVHLRVDPEDYVDSYNAIQLVTPLVLAISANSPGLFGHDLWDETRVPLFKQSIDTRHADRYRWSEPARVDFGHGWLRRGPLEPFEESVRLYRPLLPACSEEAADEDGIPRLDELRLHQSTVWRWNRAVYDHGDGGHLRIEMRALPAGPTAVDMVAGAALMLGLARGLRDRLPRLLPALPFTLAAYNFYRAAQHGLGARIVWPRERQQGLRDAGLIDVLTELLPTAEDGMALLGISREERDRYLQVIERRVAERRSGAVWQRACTRALVDGGLAKRTALAQMLERYQEHSVANEPVSEWPL
jgi:gamma-glutamyl:cysteine ligase YbdK (ATP-grasp superfamily)